MSSVAITSSLDVESSLFESCCESWLWYLAINTTIKIKINQSNCSHWFYLIVAMCFSPHSGPSSGSLVKSVSCYWTVEMWIHFSATYHNHIMHATVTKLQKCSNFKMFKNLDLFEILSSLNVKFYVVFVSMSRTAGCRSQGVRCYTVCYRSYSR
jgi:hypothetical protein